MTNPYPKYHVSTDLIPVPWDVNGVAVLACGHAAFLTAGELALGYAYGYMRCPWSGEGQRVMGLLVRRP